MTQRRATAPGADLATGSRRIIIRAMAARYPIPAARHQTVSVVLRSRFIAVADLAPDLATARALLQEMRAAHPAATHHVHAFRVGHGASLTEGMGDDGEPPGTAGRPTMAVLTGSGLGDVCLVTVRYFGGAKLGTGGLVRAYTQAAQTVLAELPRGWHEEKRRLSLLLSYSTYEPVRRLMDTMGAELLSEDFGAQVTVEMQTAADRADALADALREATAGQARITVHGGVTGAPSAAGRHR